MQNSSTLTLLLGGLLAIGSLNTIQAQTLDPVFQATVLKSNTSLGVQSAPNLTLVQPNGKVLIAGGFDFANGVSASKIQRLNADGTNDVTFNPGGLGANGFISALQLQPDGRILIGGGFTTYNGTDRLTVARLNANGTLDPTFVPSGITARRQIGALALQADGKILVGGGDNLDTGIPGGGVARLNADGSLDTSFNIGTGITSPQGFVRAVFVQADGKVLVGGTFTSFNDQTVSNVVRLTATGSLDPGFAATTDGAVRAIDQQPDGKIVLGGSFEKVNSAAAPRLARLLINGTIDPAFNVGTGPNGTVASLMVQRNGGAQFNGSIVFAGSFTQVNGAVRNRVARVFDNGTVDATFANGVAANGAINSVTQIGAGQFLLAGYFSQYDGVVKTGLARITATGTNEASFGALTEANGFIGQATPLASGKILIIGTFNSFNGTPVPTGVRRLNADGTLDNTYTTTFTTGFGVQPDGRFFVVSSTPTQYSLIRVNAAGAVDNTFTSALFGAVPSMRLRDIVMQPDGRYLVFGSFTTYSGAVRNGIARLTQSGALDDTFLPPASPIARTITSAVVQRTGRIVIAYEETGAGATAGTKLLRLNADGSPDNTFAVGAGASPATFFTVLAQPDGKLLLTGAFTSFNGESTPFGMARLNADGSVDASFDSFAGSFGVRAVQADGRLLGLTGTGASTAIVRLNANGSRDNSFIPVNIPTAIFVGDDFVSGLALQPADGKILVFGAFRSVAGQMRIGLARLLNPGVTSTRATVAKLPLTVYPNPAQTQLNVQLPASQLPLRVFLRNLQGQNIASWPVPANRAQTTLDVRNVAAGLYILQIPTAGSTYQQKVIITK
ncbi:T9SS type A sorting domain-containing protein [Hymenobacter psychrophilus]|uniref:Delta-60 repeat domain-containing protein/Por secretion system C-terminal sorting domain-containing protein n=1 Tax=Hymenobacter psychrophilus TaxID=651662 RepID=A0A1H3LVY3_9BACT|nr:T9SS type A sorting domain-containing protein [Hymenobacter psychrophilus]SDY68516.1 delta-60 repeat domain-containing protein/Por secretion system C-terminal sorting domain-containing protein [Hymenobacter psychrophilus]